MMQKIWNNPRYRYRTYIEAIEKLSLHPRTKELLLCYFLRLAENSDKKKESSVTDYDVTVLRYELAQGKYGNEQKNSFTVLSEQRQDTALRYMLLQKQTGESLLLYGKALTAILGDGVLYKNRRNPAELLL